MRLSKKILHLSFAAALSLAACAQPAPPVVEEPTPAPEEAIYLSDVLNSCLPAVSLDTKISEVSEGSEITIIYI